MLSKELQNGRNNRGATGTDTPKRTIGKFGFRKISKKKSYAYIKKK
jgi:hypothetical protein